MNNQPIGILDSGIGGFSIYREIVTLLPHESIVYVGDNANVPFGALAEEEIYDRSQLLVSFLLEKGAKIIVIACNTITVTSIDRLRKAFPHVSFIGTVPVVKTASTVTKNGRIGILSTSRTAGSTYQKDLINKFANGHMVINEGTDELVPLIERGEIDGEAMHKVLELVLEPFKKEQVDTVALGCTHYPFVRRQIQEVLGNDVRLLDSGAAIARQVQRILTEMDALVVSGPPTKEFYTTGDTKIIDGIAKNLLGATIATTTVTL